MTDRHAPSRAVDRLPADLVARLASRRGGRLHAFTSLDPRATALVVVDMTKLFVSGQHPAEAAVISRINALAGALRAQGGSVIWVSPAPFARPELMEQLLGEAAVLHQNAQREGDERNALVSGLDVRNGDLRARKGLYSAFFPGSSDAAEQLEARGVNTVLIGGTVTDVCCEASARDAFSRGFRTILIADACLGSSEDAHARALAAIHRNFGDVRDTGEVLDLLMAGAKREAAE